MAASDDAVRPVSSRRVVIRHWWAPSPEIRPVARRSRDWQGRHGWRGGRRRHVQGELGGWGWCARRLRALRLGQRAGVAPGGPVGGPRGDPPLGTPAAAVWRARSSGGESAALIRPRSLVRVQARPPGAARLAGAVWPERGGAGEPRGRSLAGRAPPLHGGGPGFESPRLHPGRSDARGGCPPDAPAAGSHASPPSRAVHRPRRGWETSSELRARVRTRFDDLARGVTTSGGGRPHGGGPSHRGDTRGERGSPLPVP